MRQPQLAGVERPAGEPGAARRGPRQARPGGEDDEQVRSAACRAGPAGALGASAEAALSRRASAPGRRRAGVRAAVAQGARRADARFPGQRHRPGLRASPHPLRQRRGRRAVPQQLQVRGSELRDVPHGHRQEHHPPAGQRGQGSRPRLGRRPRPFQNTGPGPGSGPRPRSQLRCGEGPRSARVAVPGSSGRPVAPPRHSRQLPALQGSARPAPQSCPRVPGASARAISPAPTLFPESPPTHVLGSWGGLLGRLWLGLWELSLGPPPPPRDPMCSPHSTASVWTTAPPATACAASSACAAGMTR